VNGVPYKWLSRHRDGQHFTVRGGKAHLPPKIKLKYTPSLEEYREAVLMDIEEYKNDFMWLGEGKIDKDVLREAQTYKKMAKLARTKDELKLVLIQIGHDAPALHTVTPSIIKTKVPKLSEGRTTETAEVPKKDLVTLIAERLPSFIKEDRKKEDAILKRLSKSKKTPSTSFIKLYKKARRYTGRENNG